MRSVTLCLTPAGEPAVLLPHGRRGELAPYLVRFGAGGEVLLTSPRGAVYCVERAGSLWSCPCPAYRYSARRPCKHCDAAAMLTHWIDGISAHDGHAPSP